jgi:hypothetical protein
MGQDHEEGIARRMRNAEDVGRRDVLGGVPERRGRREGRDVEAEHEETRERGEEVRGGVALLGGGVGHEITVRV